MSGNYENLKYSDDILHPRYYEGPDKLGPESTSSKNVNQKLSMSQNANNMAQGMAHPSDPDWSPSRPGGGDFKATTATGEAGTKVTGGYSVSLGSGQNSSAPKY